MISDYNRSRGTCLAITVTSSQQLHKITLSHVSIANAKMLLLCGGRIKNLYRFPVVEIYMMSINKDTILSCSHRIETDIKDVAASLPAIDLDNVQKFFSRLIHKTQCKYVHKNQIIHSGIHIITCPKNFTYIFY